MSVRTPTPSLPAARALAPRTWLLAGLLAASYLVAARFSLLLSFPGTNASPIWPPSGLALAGLLLLGVRAWPAITLGAFVANLTALAQGPTGLTSTALAMSSAIAVGNTLEAVVGAQLLLRHGSGSPLAGVRDAGRFLLVTMVACALSAGTGTTTLAIAGSAPPSALTTIMLTWWLGDVTGILVVAPFLLFWLRSDAPGAARCLPQLALIAVTAALSWCTFSSVLADVTSARLLIYAAVPLIALAALYCDGRLTASVVLVWSIAAVWGTINGHGPFTRGPLNDALILLDTFLGLCSLTGVLLAADCREARARGRARGRARFTELGPSWIALLGCLGLTVVAWHVVTIDTERRASERFAFQFDEIDRRIEERLLAYEQILWGAASLLRGSEEVTRDEWREYVEAQQVDARFPGLQGLGYAVLVPAENKLAHERKVQAEGFPGYAIRPPGVRPVYSAIIYLEPFDWRNRRAFGFDMLSEPIRRRAMEQARDTARSAVSGRVRLLQETQRDTQAGFLMYVPTYRRGAPLETVAERRAALLGFVYSPFRMGDLMNGVLHGSPSSLSLEIFDGDRPDPKHALYESHPGSNKVDPHYRHPLERIGTSTVSQQRWTLRARSLPLFEHEIDRQKAQIVLFSGALLSLLFFVMVRTLARTRTRALELADAMTAALRDAETRFTSLANATSEGIVLLDASGAITSWNPGAAAMFEASEAAMHGKSWLTLVSESDRETAEHTWRALISDGGAAGDERAQRSLAVLGQTLRDRTFPLEGSLCSWLADGRPVYGLMVRDVSERKLAAEQLTASLALQISERKQREQEAQAALREKETLLKEVYHRVKNNLQVVSSLFNLQLRALPEGPGRQSLLEGAARVRAMALVHEKLYQSADLSSIQLDGYIEELCGQLATAAAARERGIHLVMALEHVEAGLELAVPLGLLLNELVSNSLKHGFPDGRAGTVRVALQRTDDGRCLLEVADDGAGFAPGALEPSARSLGLRLVRTLSRQLHGDLTLDNRAGAYAGLSFCIDIGQARAHTAARLGRVAGAR